MYKLTNITTGKTKPHVSYHAAMFIPPKGRTACVDMLRILHGDKEPIRYRDFGTFGLILHLQVGEHWYSVIRVDSQV